MARSADWYEETMKHLLLRLAATPDRALRLLSYCVDREEEVEHHVDACGTVSFRELGLPDPDPARRFRSIGIWLEGAAAEPSLIEAFCAEGGSVVQDPKDADLLVATGPELAELERKWPRRLVLSLSEMKAEVIGDQLRPLRASGGPPGSLPKQLRSLWNQLRSGSVRQIIEGLDAFSVISTDNPSTGDLLLTEVGIDVSSGTLIRGNRFERAKEDANPHLLYALLGLLSRSAVGSRGELLRRALRTLQAKVPSLPEMRGFDGLRTLELDLDHYYGDPDGGVQASIAERFGPMPALQMIRISTNYDPSLSSLNGLDASSLQDLEVPGVGLKEIEALRCNCNLRRVVLYSNEHLRDISPLQSSMHCLQQLDISDTAVADLSVLTHAGELEDLEISRCSGIRSLRGLDRLVVTGGRLRLDELINLVSLHYLPMIVDGGLTVSGHTNLENLDGIESAADLLTSLQIHRMNRLTDLGALRNLQHLESISISECPQITSLEVLAELPCLKYVRVSECKKLSTLPDVWPNELEDLSLENCPVSRLGLLPNSLRGSLNLIHYPKLRDLDGLGQCTKLSELTIRASITNLQPLASLPDLWITIDLAGAESTLPDALIDALSELPQCRLRLSDSDRWSPIHLRNPEGLARITHLRALDLSGCELDDLLPIMGLTELELLKIRPRSELSKKHGGCTFDTPGQIAKLQLQVLGMN